MKMPASSSLAKRAQVAAAAGDGATLRDLLRVEPELIEDARLINAAALCGRPETTRLLLEAGAHPDARVASHEAYRPLHRAIEHRGVKATPGHGEVVDLLLAAGASLEARATWMQLTPWAVAGMAGDDDMVARLRRAGGSNDDVFAAAIMADADAVQRFLRRKAAAQAADANAMTALHYAALGGFEERAPAYREIVERLLDAGADGDIRTPIGPFPPTAPLHFAAWKNYAAAEALLERGCDPNLGFPNCLWRPPGPMAELFFRHGADVNARDPSGQPLLTVRIHWNLPSVALWLLEEGADPNLPAPKGNTPLHEAARRGINPKVVSALLARGARRDAKNHAGERPIDLARRKKATRLIPLLDPED